VLYAEMWELRAWVWHALYSDRRIKWWVVWIMPPLPFGGYWGYALARLKVMYYICRKHRKNENRI
jgi:hypothetical protein